MIKSNNLRCAVVIAGALLVPLAALLAQAAPPAPPAPAAVMQTAAAPTDTAAVDTIDYESMMLPEGERDYWSLEYYQSELDQDDGDWDENRREREDQREDDRRDYGD